MEKAGSVRLHAAAGCKMIAFATGTGQMDTNAITLRDGRPNPSPHAGKDYRGVTGADIVRLVSNPPRGVEKERAQWFIPSSYIAHDARDHEAQRQRGLFHWLTLDVDSGNLDVQDIVDGLQTALGPCRYLIYSTSSATPENRKWRALVPLAAPIAGADFKDTQNAFYTLLEDASQGILIPDRALARAAQLVYLPSPRTDFYHHLMVKDAPRLDLKPDHPVIALREADRARQREADAAAEAHRQERQASRALATVGAQESPIDVFNERHAIADLLSRYGYARAGQSNDWRSRYQSTKSYATRDCGAHWVSLSGSDDAADLGRATKNGARWGDAFDLYTHFEHGGDIKKAVQSYAREAGISNVRMVWNDQPEQVFSAAPTTQPDKQIEAQPKRNDLAEWVFLSSDNEFYHRRTSERMGVAAFNLAMIPFTPAVSYEKPNGEIVNKKFPPSKTLVEYLEGKVVAHTMYRPDVPDQFFSVDGIEYVNSYLPHTVPNADPDWKSKEAWKVCKQHIENILGGEAHLIIKWMAHNVQKPGKKILWSPVIVGVQGDGKTTLYKMMMAAMGQANVGVVSPEAMFSDFTGWAEGSCVKVLEEIRVHGNSRHNAMNKLKPLITNDSVEVVRKGQDGKQIANVTNYMALTNHMDALALDEGDRRWGVFKTRFETRQHMLAELDDAYWSRLHGAIDREPEVIRGWLLAVDLSCFNRVVGPETNAHKMTMIEATRSPQEADIKEALELGGFGVAADVAATDCINSVIQGQGGRQAQTSVLANIMRELGWQKFGATVKWKGKNRRIYYKPGPDFEGLDEGGMMRVFRAKLDATDEGGFA
jgi:hypothetical protein